MPYEEFYDLLFKPVEERVGPIDHDTLCAIVGFDAGGPLNLCTVGSDQEFVTYVSCELAVRNDQRFGAAGPYEVMTTCDDEEWARMALSCVGRMGLDVALGDGHTMDLGPMVGEGPEIQGVVLENFASVDIEGTPCRILRIHGVGRDELALAVGGGADRLLAQRRASGLYPRTCVR